MSHFAQVVDGLVQQVIVAEQDFINGLPDPERWVQTSYNMRGGIHYEPNSDVPRPDQSGALRKNYAGIGYSYDSVRDAFIPPRPFASWTLNEFSCLWQAPVPYPTDGGVYRWDEDTLNWIVIEP